MVCCSPSMEATSAGSTVWTPSYLVDSCLCLHRVSVPAHNSVRPIHRHVLGWLFRSEYARQRCALVVGKYLFCLGLLMERSASGPQRALAGIWVPELYAAQWIQQTWVCPLPADTHGLFVCLHSMMVDGACDTRYLLSFLACLFSERPEYAL